MNDAAPYRGRPIYFLCFLFAGWTAGRLAYALSPIVAAGIAPPQGSPQMPGARSSDRHVAVAGRYRRRSDLADDAPRTSAQPRATAAILCRDVRPIATRNFHAVPGSTWPDGSSGMNEVRAHQRLVSTDSMPYAPLSMAAIRIRQVPPIEPGKWRTTNGAPNLSPQVSAFAAAGPAERLAAYDRADPQGANTEAGLSPVVPARRWHGSVWLFARGDTGIDRQRASATRMTDPAQRSQARYGGSQAGAIVSYALDNRHRTRGYARVSTDSLASELAAGLQVVPLVSMPVALHVEHRVGLNGGKRGTALFATGGIQPTRVADRLAIMNYWQAGYVGSPTRSGFVETGSQLRYDLGRDMHVGAGLWTGSQCKVARVDIGPRVEWRAGSLNVAADWRIRISGNALPKSGPALTIAADF